MCFAETFNIFTRQPRTKKYLRNIHNRLVFYRCVSNIQLIAGKWKKKTKALLLGFGEEARKRTSCQVHVQEHSLQLDDWTSLMVIMPACGLAVIAAQTLTLQIYFLLRFHTFGALSFLMLNLMHFIWWYKRQSEISRVSPVSGYSKEAVLLFHCCCDLTAWYHVISRTVITIISHLLWLRWKLPVTLPFAECLVCCIASPKQCK